MHRLLLSILMPLSLFAQATGGLFPIPAMQEHWTGSGLTSNDGRLLSRAIKADLGNCKIPASDQYPDGELDFASVTLGKLGNGVLVRVENSCSCGATGNCAIYLYVQAQGRYRQIPLCEPSRGRANCEDSGPSGWAFAEVPSESGVPDLVFAANSAAAENHLTLYRYQGGNFIRRKCERLVAKGNRTPRSWWDASEVEVLPCAGS